MNKQKINKNNQSNIARLPMVSVITIVRNGEKYIRQTIESVLAQDYPSIEYIVIDGASIDGTKAIIDEYREHLAHYVSEPDLGISDAWNKGIRAARGEYIAFLNADDYYMPSFIRRSILENSGTSNEIIYGSTLVVDEADKSNHSVVNRRFDLSHVVYGFGFRHPSCLTHRKIFDNVGLFNVNVRIACDSDFLLRCVKAKVSFKQSSALVVMRRGGISDRQWRRATLEYVMRLEMHGFIDQAGARRQRAIVPILQLNRFIGFMSMLRKFKTQSYFLGLFLINIMHSLLPFFMRTILYRACGFEVHSGATLQGGVRFFHLGRMRIGNGSVINRGVYLDNRCGIEIGECVSIAHDVKIYSLGHDIHNDLFPVKGRQVVIEDYVVIFAGAMIMPGIRIGKGSVVMAGAVVTRDVPAFRIVGGNPACDLGARDSLPAYRFDRRFWFAH
jgi:glycosyltransferase involved in cell wall biosynthesis/carbonic anhydrase/acetyltransferase-like protein (isoleucine patch superfamily)